MTYLFFFHYSSLVKHISSQIIVMYLGRVVERAAPEELFKNPLHPYTQALLASIPVPDPDVKLRKGVLKGEISSPINMSEECRFINRCPSVSDECRNRSMPEKEVVKGHFAACCHC